MAADTDLGREAITASLNLLATALSNKYRSKLPRIFTEYKRDELVSIYQGQQTSAQKEPIYEILSKINASQSSYWKKLRQ